MISQDFQIIKSAFQPLEFSKEEDDYFHEVWREERFSKGDFITEAGKVERKFYIALEGVQAIYLIDRRGEKVVFGFSFDGSFSGIYDSFLEAAPAHYFLEALTDSRLAWIDKTTYDSLFEKFPSFEKWGRIFHQDILIGRIKREIELVTLPAEERYRRFIQRCPEPLKRIPQKYLASYLNMSPETFSRLRARVRL
jgi:CRP-like cAMP-binding protein